MSGIYSDEANFFSKAWFQGKSADYESYSTEANKLIEWFQAQYGIEQLKSLSGKKLLDTLFYSDSEHKENLCYDLEMNAQIKSFFGSISGGSAYKFGLFFHRQKKCWMAGSSLKPQQLTEDEAISLGTQIRDNLVAGAETIQSWKQFDSSSDYEQLYKKVSLSIRLENIWVLKYYKMLFPALFASAYSDDAQKHMLYALQIEPCNNQFVRMGQIALACKELGVSCEVMQKIFTDTIGWGKVIYRIGTGDSGTALFSNWAANGYCALDFGALGNFNQYLDEKGRADKEKIADTLFEQIDAWNKSTATRKANEISDFINAEANETIVVAMNGQTLMGIGFLRGPVEYNDSLDEYANIRKTEWQYIAPQDMRLPTFEGRLTSFVPMVNDDNMLEIYRLLYKVDSKFPNEDSWWPTLAEYNPGISTEKWEELLQRSDVVGPVWGGLLAAFFLHNPATCKEIGNIYGRSARSIVSISTHFAKTLQKITNCPTTTRENGQTRYWTILFQGKNASVEQDGTYVWKIRPELYEALRKIDITRYEWEKPSTQSQTWLLIWNPNIWQWDDYEKRIAETMKGQKIQTSWTCTNGHVSIGDRVFLSVCGKNCRKGIIASGTAMSVPTMRPHWDAQKREQGIQYKAIDVEFDKLVDFRTNDMLPLEVLQASFPNQAWCPQSSGISIRQEYVEDLIDMWYGGTQKQPQYDTGLECDYSRNRIIFGAPGTGKSYRLNQDKDDLLANGGSYERVTFHPEYSYAHFVGTYKPVPYIDHDGHKAITYKYVPGPFMRIYVKAIRNCLEDNPQPFLLIIEEINRANVAAVFGDVFQLLDRDDNETSEYTIQASEDMKQYLAEELGGSASDYSSLRLPDNLFIWATMNSADQGVFPMDTAFKRRWEFTYLGIDAGEDYIAGKEVVLGNGAYQRIVEWNKLRKAINDKLASFRVNEDKLLGPFFLSKKIFLGNGEINTERFAEAFKNKVLMYLYEDAAKQKRASLFAGDIDTTKYSSICNAFDERGVFIFCSEISTLFQIADGDSQ